MRLLNVVFFLAGMACTTIVYQYASGLLTLPSATATVSPPGMHQQAPESQAHQVNNRYAKQVLERIVGHEKEPAEKVFKNIRIPWLKAVPAEVLVDIMNEGYSRALGVACTYCHVEKDFASDDKRPKRAAREMAIMHRMINEQLGKMENLEGTPEERFINCAVCHRGSVDPRSAGEIAGARTPPI